MALQDLTPQLRTRLSRVERVVGLFVTVATLLLLAGFAYYIYHTAERKGWFKTKIYYSTSLNNAAGLKEGDPVRLMGFSVGEITKVEANNPWDYYNVTVFFRIKEPYYGYIWLDSKVKVAPADFLGNRSLEILKGREGVPTVLETNQVAVAMLDYGEVNRAHTKAVTELLQEVRAENPHWPDHAIRMEAMLLVTNQLNEVIRQKPDVFYVALDKAQPYWLDPMESPAVTERMETIVNGLESALPNILDLTNRLNSVLTGVNEATSQLTLLLAEARPVATNMAIITDNLREPRGSLGEWLLPTNLHEQVLGTLKTAEATLKTADETLKTVDGTLANTDSNLTQLATSLDRSLENLASLTGNLNAQVQANTNIVGEISSAIVNADDLVQGLKRHWLLRSAFKTNKTERTFEKHIPAPKWRK